MDKRGLSDARKRANAKWDAEHLKRMSLAIPIELYNRLKIHTARRGESVNKYIRQTIERAMDAEDATQDK